MPKATTYTWETYNWLGPFTPTNFSAQAAPATPVMPVSLGQPPLQVGAVQATTLVSTSETTGALTVTGAATLTSGAKLGNGATAAGTIYSGSGVPSAGLGANGDFYFRTDTPGTANQRLYAKSAGAWAGIV